MKRRLVLLLLLLVGGAIVNVAMAWSCNIGTWRLLFGPAGTLTEAERLWLAQFEDRLSEHSVTVRRQSRFGWRENAYFVTTTNAQQERRYFITTYGWPCPALHDKSTPSQRSEAMDLDEVSRQRDGKVRWFRYYPQLNTISLGNQMQPIEPIWPGFAINTVFYAVILWLLFAGPFVLRRRRRIRCGLCSKCAYDLRGTPPNATTCPECGVSAVRSCRETSTCRYGSIQVGRDRGHSRAACRLDWKPMVGRWWLHASDSRVIRVRWADSRWLGYALVAETHRARLAWDLPLPSVIVTE